MKSAVPYDSQVLRNHSTQHSLSLCGSTAHVTCPSLQAAELRKNREHRNDESFRPQLLIICNMHQGEAK